MSPTLHSPKALALRAPWDPKEAPLSQAAHTQMALRMWQVHKEALGCSSSKPGKARCPSSPVSLCLIPF